MKIKIFKNNEIDLERQVNKFLSRTDIEIINILQSSGKMWDTYNNGDRYIRDVTVISILYKEI